VATERWPLVRAVWPDARAQPEIFVPTGVRQDWSREEAIVYLVRGRVECVGPVTARILAQSLGLQSSDVEVALAALELQGMVLRGRFTSSESISSEGGNAGRELEWCDRRLLARIHRLTLEGLRRQIAPVSPEQLIRFLVRHQHLHPQTKLRGQDGLLTLIEQLEGFEAPAGHWEKHLLPARLAVYEPAWLDILSFSGQAAWGRLRPPGSVSAGNGRPMKALTRSTPVALMLREHVAWLLPPASGSVGVEVPAAEDLRLGSNARAAYEAFLRHGALFPAQLGALLQMVPSQVEDVLGELASAGLVTSDGYASLRSLIGEDSPKGKVGIRRFHATPRAASRPTGRWTLLRSALTPAVAAEDRIEHWCRLLLGRYGVMFRDLLANESAAPTWPELVRTYRRLEARGEIRGGRFVSNVAGEQYALAEVIPILRSAGDDPNDKPLILPATDPLNFTGRIQPGPRVPALPGHTIVLASGYSAACEDSACAGLPPR
jgi:ATP-dependent Lhr-like helicase